MNCQNCLKCPPGYEANPPCRSDSISPRPVLQICRRCKRNHFKSSLNEFGCQACLQCLEGREYVRNCTATWNAKCSDKCKFEKYFGKDNLCYPCCRCHRNQRQIERQCVNVVGKVSIVFCMASEVFIVTSIIA